MHHAKFIQVLRALNKAEFKRFNKFVRSEFFNRDKSVIKLFDVVKNYYPEFKSKALAKEIIHKKVFPGKKFSKKDIERISSCMLRLTQEFLSYISIKQEPFISAYHLLHELNERKQFNLFEKNLKIANRILNEYSARNSVYYSNKHRLEKLIIRYHNLKESAPFLVEDNAQQIADNLIYFFLIEILDIYGYMAFQMRNAFEINFKFTFIEQLKEHFKSNAYENDSNIMVSYLRLMLILTEEEEYYRKLRKIIPAQKIDDIQKMNTYITLLNFCFRRQNKGFNSFIKEEFELYKEVLSDKVYLNRKFIPHLFYKDIVTCSLSLKKFDWAEKFINNYKAELSDEHKSSMPDLCLSILYFAKKSYDTSLSYLSKVQMEDITYKLDIKSLTLRIYYEINAGESLISLIDSYKHLLSKNKLIPERLKERHSNFLKFAEKLLKIKDNFNEYEKNSLKKEIESSFTLMNKPWLIEKLNEFA